MLLYSSETLMHAHFSLTFQTEGAYPLTFQTEGTIPLFFSKFNVFQNTSSYESYFYSGKQKAPDNSSCEIFQHRMNSRLIKIDN